MKLKTILIILEQVVNSILHLIKSSDKPRQETVENLRNPKEKQRIVEGVRRFFGENYELRYNVMKQSEEYRPRHSMEVPGKSTEVPGKSTEVPDNCQELPWSRKKSLYGPGDKSVPVATPCRNNFGKISPKYLEYAEIFRIFAMSIRTNDI